MYIIFDTETTGLPQRKAIGQTDHDVWPRIIQLAYAVYDSNHQLTHAHSSLIKPDGWVVPDDDFQRANGQSTARCEEHGKPLFDEINRFIVHLSKCKYLIAHNVTFDHKVVKVELDRMGVAEVLDSLTYTKACTMMLSASTDIVKDHFGKYKRPSLQALHTILFGSEFDGAHDAGADVAATAKCFFELLDRGEVVV